VFFRADSGFCIWKFHLKRKVLEFVQALSLFRRRVKLRLARLANSPSQDGDEEEEDARSPLASKEDAHVVEMRRTRRTSADRETIRVNADQSLEISVVDTDSKREGANRSAESRSQEYPSA